MYAVVARYSPISGRYSVRCGNSEGHPTRESFDHSSRNPREDAINRHIARCAGCKRMTEQGYEPVFGTLPTADGDAVAVWIYTDR